MTVRIGIVGVGDIARLHVEALRGAGAEVVAVAGLAASEVEAFADEHDVPGRHLGAESLLTRPELDAVVIATPNPLHATQTREALRSGMHVLCEIPAGVSLREARAVAADANLAGREVMVAHTLRFAEPWLRLREAIACGAFTPRHLVLRRVMMRRGNGGWSGNARSWADSVLWHHGAHQVDLALWLLLGERPDPTGIEAFGAVAMPWEGNGQPMDFGAVIRCGAGGIATLSLSYHSQIPLEDALVIGDESTLLLRGGVFLDAAKASSGTHDATSDRAEADGMKFSALRRQDAEFVSAIVEGRSPRSSIRDVLPAMAVLEKLARS